MEMSYFWNNALYARRAKLMIKPLADNLMVNEEFVIKGNSHYYIAGSMIH